jgi:hypothetical protein
MADAFFSALFGAKELKVSARHKVGNITKTVTLTTAVPADVSEEAFLEAAKSGVTLAAKVTNGDDRGRNYTGKGISGAAATSATASVLGYTAADSVPEPVKRRGRRTRPTVHKSRCPFQGRGPSSASSPTPRAASRARSGEISPGLRRRWGWC